MSRRFPLFLVAFLVGGSLAAQQPSPLSQPNPAAPTLNPAAPLGMQRGTTLELTLTGTNLADPVSLVASFPAKVTIPTDNNNGKEPTKLRVVLEVPATAPLGYHTLRLTTGRGISNFRLFCIDDLPQVLEVDTNKVKSTPQPLTPPCVVVGRADAEVTDYYKITAKAGQRLTFELLGRRLGSVFDPQLILSDVKSGRELVGGLSLDAPGCQTDPRLTYTFKEDGDYLIEVRDTLWRGGPDYFYRLRVGDFPCATSAVPMAIKRGAKAAIGFAGPVVEGVPPVEVTAPTDPTVDTLWVAPKGANGLFGWPVPLDVSDFEELMEQEPNNDPAKPQKVPVPCGVTGRFLEKGDVDHYGLTLTKGQRVIVEARTHELGSPTEVFMNLKDAKGAQVAASNPMQSPRIDFTSPEGGEYVLTLEHLHYWGGPGETYHLRIAPHQPGFSLGLFLDRYDVPLGAPLSIPVSLIARRDYTGPIELSVIGPKGITGTATIAANAAAAPPPPAPAPVAATIPLTIAPDVAMGPYELVIQGKAQINGKDVIEYASLKTVIGQAMGGLAYPPRHLLTQVSLLVTEKPPFLLTAKFDPADVLRGGTATLVVTAAKTAGFDEEIVLSLGGVPANVAPAPKNIAKGQTEAKLELKPNAMAVFGSFPITVTGKAKFMNKDFSVNSLSAPLVVAQPFTLKVEPLPVKVTVGDKAKIKVTATRKGGFMGPIALEVRNLPAGVTAAKAEIAMGETAIEVELTAAENAAVGDKADVNVLGTAAAAANQQNPSANFTVSVIKK